MDIKTIKYPIYIVSKGRYDNIMTHKIFLNENIDFKIIVEPSEYESYKKNIDEKYLLKTDFDNLGLGSYPARNFAREHSIKNGFKKHFIFDDNIRCFSSFQKGIRGKCKAIDAIICLQNISDFYENVLICGYNYRYFVTKETKKPFTFNTHVYSGMIINNNMPYRRRLKYNEDVDLCLQVLNGGYCTILLNAFLIDKTSTTTKMKGGNQTYLYKDNDEKKKYLKSKSLQLVRPKYVRIVNRYNRRHHYVNWKLHFKQKLKRNNLYK